MSLINNQGRIAGRKSDLRSSKANYKFDVYSDDWELDANKKIRFRTMDSLSLEPKFLESFRLVLADYACEVSSSYTTLIFNGCKNFFSFGVRDVILESHLINYKASLGKERESITLASFVHSY